MQAKKSLTLAFLSIMLLMLAAVSHAGPADDFIKLCANGTADEVEAAIENGADVNAKKRNGETALLNAAMFNSNPDIVSLLIKKGADANNQDDREGFTVLMMVAYWSPNPIPLMRVLIDNGADVNLQNKDGLTALMFSIANFKNKESEKSIAFLLDSGANPNIKDKKGNTALDIATDMGKYNGSAILERLEEMTSAKPE